MGDPIQVIDQILRYRYPNNKPTATTVLEMAQRGMSLLCADVNGSFGWRGAWFVNIFGRHEMHMIPNAS